MALKGLQKLNVMRIPTPQVSTLTVLAVPIRQVETGLGEKLAREREPQKKAARRSCDQRAEHPQKTPKIDADRQETAHQISLNDCMQSRRAR